MIATRKQEAYLFPLLFYGQITEVVIMTKPKGRKRNEEIRGKIAELRDKDLSAKEIAGLVGCSSSYVSLIAREIGKPFTLAEARRHQSRAQKASPNCGKKRTPRQS